MRHTGRVLRRRHHTDRYWAQDRNEKTGVGEVHSVVSRVHQGQRTDVPAEVLDRYSREIWGRIDEDDGNVLESFKIIMGLIDKIFRKHKDDDVEEADIEEE